MPDRLTDQEFVRDYPDARLENTRPLRARVRKGNTIYYWLQEEAGLWINWKTKTETKI